METVDMDLKEHTEKATDFTSDAPMPNIWSIADDDDKPEEEAKYQAPAAPVVSAHDEDELERPSFLRRLAKRAAHKEAPDDTDKAA
jgi:hypothetical protein